MERHQTVALMDYLNRAGHLRIVEGQVAVWHDALSDLDADAASDAVRTIVRERTSAERPVVPGDIRAEINRARIVSPWDRVYRDAEGQIPGKVARRQIGSA